MIDVVGLLAGTVAVIALWWSRTRKPKLPMPVDDGPGLDLMAQVRQRNFRNHVERVKTKARK